MAFTPKLTFKDLIEAQKQAYQEDHSNLSAKRQLKHKLFNTEQQILFERTRGIVQDLIQIRPFLTDVDAQKLEQYASERFYDPNFIAVLQIYFDVLVIPNPDNQLAKTPSARLFRQWLTDLKPLASGLEGTTFVSNLGNIKDIFVIKAPNNVLDRGPIHEQFVAMVYTNSLKRLCPNFAGVFGSFMCSPPLADKQYAEVQGFCYHNIMKYSSNHLVYENVGSKSLRAWLTSHLNLKSLTKTMLLSAILQLILSLELANSQPFPKLQGFQHGDAHTKNIVVRELEREGAIYWPQRGRYLQINRIMTWIDFARSHIKWDGKDYMLTYFRRDGLGETVFPLADVIMFLIDIMVVIFYEGSKQSEADKPYYMQFIVLLLPIYHWFFQSQESFPAMYSKIASKELRGRLPYDSRWTNVTVSSLLDYILSHSDYKSLLDKLWLDKSELPLLSCAVDNDQCSSLNDYLYTTTYKSNQKWPIPRTIFELADQAGIGRQFVADYQAPPWNDNWYKLAYNELLQQRTELNKIPRNVFNVGVETYTNQVSMESFLSYEQNILRYTQIWLRIRELTLIPLLVLYYFYPQKLELMNDYYDYFNDFVAQENSWINRVLESIQVNLVTISNHIRDPESQLQIYRRGIDILRLTVTPVLSANPTIPELNDIGRKLERI